MTTEVLSNNVFNKIRSKFGDVQLGDSDGNVTADPNEAVFYDFEYMEDADTFGRMSISLADGESMKVFYNRNLTDKIDEDSKANFFSFLKELKDLAVQHQLKFDVRDITKSNLSSQDFKNLADTNQTVNTDEMSEEINRITSLAGVKEAEPEAGLTGGPAPTTIAKQFPGVDDKSSLVRAVTKMKQGQSNYSRDEITAAADAFKEILGKDPNETSRLMTMLKGVAQKANPFNHPDDWVGHGMMKNKDANAKGKGRGTDRKGTVWGTESVDEVEKITKLAGVEVKESLRGTTKSSYENLDKTRLIIRHKGKVDETIPGARSRQIQSLYIENSDGERYKYPLTHLAGARAMVRHVANGGKPHDDFGQHIIQTSEDIAKLNSFSRYASNKDQLNDNASDIIEQTKMKLENLRQYVRNLGKQSHYDETFKNFKTAEERVLDDETRNTYREKFTLKTLDDRVEEALPLIHDIMSEYKTDEPTDKDAKVEPPVDHGAIVQSWLTNPDNKLVLRKDDTADKMLAVTKFNNKNTMLGSILSDIAARMMSKGNDDDRVANFASRVADEIEKEGTPFATHDQDYLKNKKIAVMLAKRYIDDYKKMKSDPAYGDEVRVDPQAFAPKKDRQGKAKETEAFENWVNNIDAQAVEDKGSTLASRIIRKAADEDPESMDHEMFKRSADMLDAGELEELGKHIHDSDTAPREFVMKTIADHDPETFKQMYGDQEGYLATMKPKGLDVDSFNGESVTFEDIKPYVSMYRDEQTGKMTYDVLDKDEQSAYKTTDSKAAMAYLSKNFKKLRMDKDERIDQAMAAQKKDAETNPNWGKDKGPVDPEKDHREISRIMKYEGLNESRAKIVESIKSKVALDTAEADAELSRIVQLSK